MSFLPVQPVLDTAIQSRFLDTHAKKVVGVGLVLTALHVASAFTAVAINAWRGLYDQDHFQGEYKPTTPLQHAFKDLGAYLLLSQLINKISSLFKTQTPAPQLEIRAVSWNLSSVNDLVTAVDDGRAIGNDAAKDRYKKVSLAHMKKIIHGFGPDIILMQELVGSKNEKGRYEHTPLLDLLRTNGYRIYAPGNGPAVAFKEKVFKCKGSPNSLREDSACIELKHKATGQKIRAVSDHLAGFSSTEYMVSQETNQPFTATRIGDNQLFDIVERLKPDDQNDILVIYGLDSNTTPPGVYGDDQKILHPERLSPLLSCTFVRDKNSDKEEHATIVDHNSNLPLKFDHIFCWHLPEIPTVTRQIIDDINGPQLLQKEHLFTTTGSDHLPVAAIITLPNPKKCDDQPPG